MFDESAQEIATDHARTPSCTNTDNESVLSTGANKAQGQGCIVKYSNASLTVLSDLLDKCKLLDHIETVKTSSFALHRC